MAPENAEVAGGVVADADVDKVESTVIPSETVEESNEVVDETEQVDTTRAEGAPELGWELTFPEDLPIGLMDERATEILGEWGAAAAGAGLPHDIAQGVVDSFAQAHAALGVNRDFSDNSYEEGESTLRAHWGDAFEKNLAVARHNASVLGPRFQNWLEEQQINNDPRVMIALADLADLNMSKGAAQAEIDKLMKLPDYMSPDAKKRNVIIQRISNLSKVANREEQTDEQKLNATLKRAEPYPNSHRTTPTSAPRETISKMLADRNHPLNISGHRDHAAAVAEFQALLARI